MPRLTGVTEGIARVLRRHPASALCGALLLIKLALLAVEPVARFFLGDSGIYIHAALTRTMPRDRSFVYPWLLEWIAVAPQTLSLLLAAQALCGVAVAMLAWAILRHGFDLDARIAAAIAMLIAIGPEQLFYERMVMAECWGLLGFAVMLSAGFAYLRGGHVVWLALLALGGILAVSLRTNLAPVVLGFSVLPVLLRFGVHERAGSLRWKRFAAHLLVVTACTAALHAGYRRIPVHGTENRPDYIGHAGYFRLGLVAPYIDAADLRDLGLPDGFLDRLRPGLHDPRERESHLWVDNGLIPTLRHMLGDEAGDHAARKIVSRIVKRDRLALLHLAGDTLADYFEASVTAPRMLDDLGLYRFDDGIRSWIGREFNHDMRGMPEKDSPVLRWFAASAGWLTGCLFAVVPLSLCMLAAHWRGALRAPALLLMLATLGLFLGHALFSPIVSFRYLHAFPLLLGINLGALAAGLSVRGSEKTGAVPS